jgi:hypothetical protein
LFGLSVVVFIEGNAFDIERFWTNVLFMRPLNCPEGDLDLAEIVEVFKFSEDAEIEIGLHVESPDAAVIELQVERKIFIGFD